MMRKTFFFLTFFLSLLPALATSAAQTPAPTAEKLPDLNSIEWQGTQLFEQTGVTGMVMVVVRDNRVYFKGFGETAPGSGQLPTEDSVVRLCSLTKIFTTDLLVKLEADHTLKLDDPLEKYAPQGATIPQREADITLLNLATHTSGLPREVGWPGRGTPHFTYPDYKTRWDWLATQSLLSVPGTKALYSNVGMDLLADAMAAAAQKRYSSLLWDRTLVPLEMWETTYFPTAAQCALLMQGKHKEGECTDTYQTVGSSGLYSTPHDMEKWLKYLLGLGGATAPKQSPEAQRVFIDPATLKRQFGLEHAGKPSGIGLGWMHLGELSGENHIIEKTGGGAGFTTYIAINPAHHAAIFIAATEGTGKWEVNLFKAANNILLDMVGLPTEPLEEIKHAPAKKKTAQKSTKKAAPEAKKSAPAAKKHVKKKKQQQ